METVWGRQEYVNMIVWINQVFNFPMPTERFALKLATLNHCRHSGPHHSPGTDVWPALSPLNELPITA